MVDQVVRELRELGLAARNVELPSFPASARAAFFTVPVEHGRYKDETLAVGVSFQEDAYPEYPPHFIHFRTSIKTPITRHSTHHFEGEEWAAYSLPPSDFWDRLAPAEKNMATYVRRHLLRILAQL